MRRLMRVFPIALLFASALALFTPRRGESVPLFAARQGLPCQSCHFDPEGGGARNEFGFAFARNRHSVEAETEGEWKDLTLSNRVGDSFPLYIGLNQRFMLLASDQEKNESLDRLGFFNMENALHMAFQPHPRLTLVYTRDGFNEGSRSKEAFGLIGLGGGTWLKAGQFRVPFSVRMDDHTVGSRNGFLDFQGGGGVLPYDPRLTTRGLQLGGERGSIHARAAWTENSNDNAGPFLQGSGTQTATAKLGYVSAPYQGWVSVYDDWTRTDPSGSGETARTTRWGYAGMGRSGPFALLGEVVAGTDALTSGDPADPYLKRNVLGYFAELDYAPRREWNFRLRYDRMETDRSSDEALRKASSWNRYALEGEWVPVPFAELRWTLRLVDPVLEEISPGVPLESEKQAYLQFHFSY